MVLYSIFLENELFSNCYNEKGKIFYQKYIYLSMLILYLLKIKASIGLSLEIGYCTIKCTLVIGYQISFSYTSEKKWKEVFSFTVDIFSCSLKASTITTFLIKSRKGGMIWISNFSVLNWRSFICEV